MKARKALLILIFISLLFSCTSLEEERPRRIISAEDANDALSMLYNDTLELTRENFEIADDDLSSLFPAEIASYESFITRFAVFYQEAADDLKNLLKNGALSTLRRLRNYSYRVESPLESLENIYLFSSNRDEVISLLQAWILSYITTYNNDFNESYAHLSFECEVIKKNQDNLLSVGFLSTLSSIPDFDYEEASRFTAEKLYEELYQNEISLRNTPLPLQSDERYSYFWEVV